MEAGTRSKEIIKAVYAGAFILALVTLMFALAVKGWKDSTVVLSQVDQYEGVVVDRGITVKKGKIKLNVFYFKLAGLSDNLASYNVKQDYAKLLAGVNIGDNLKVYYKRSKDQALNLDVIQIEKQGQILLDKSEYEAKESFLIYFGTIAGVVFLGLLVSLIMKTRKKLNNEGQSRSEELAS